MILNHLLITVLVVSCSAQYHRPRRGASQEALQPLPTSYQFSYSTGNEAKVAQIFREEQRSSDGSVTGKYGYVDPNGHLRVVNYQAGVNGFSASGDIGPDRETMKLAAQFQADDEATRIQNEIWQKMRSSLNWGNWGVPSWSQPQTPVTTNWNSLNPNWNSAPPPAPAAPQAPPAPAQPPSPPTPDLERQWDDRVNRADNDIPNLSNIATLNTWNSRQNSWNSNVGNGKSEKIQWETRINHDWPKPAAQNSNPPIQTQPVNFGVSRNSPTSSRPSAASIQKEWPSAHNPETNPLTGGAYVFFNVDHKGDGSSPPYNFGYSY